MDGLDETQLEQLAIERIQRVNEKYKTLNKVESLDEEPLQELTQELKDELKAR